MRSIKRTGSSFWTVQMLMQDHMDRIVDTSEDKGCSFLGNIVVMEELSVAHARTH
jgi:hypothetical protein